MKKTIFHTPQGYAVENIDLKTMRKYVIDEFCNYWSEGSGDGFIDYYINNKKVSTMMIEPNNNYGIYLHVINYNSNEDWLSVYDKNLLNEVAETADEIFVSVGLFLPIELAWKGIEQYLLQGNMSKEIDWVQPDIIPEEGNW